MVRSRVAFALCRIAPDDPLAQAAMVAVRASPEPWVRKLSTPVR
jgi:hypothetical protein